MPKTTPKKVNPSPHHPDRPFSPSPARENQHSRSRPPSLLFGAPPVGTVATSSSFFSLSGLPSSSSSTIDATLPSGSGSTRHSRAPSNDRYLSGVSGFESLPRQRHEREPAFGTPFVQDGNPVAVGQFTGSGQRHRQTSLRPRSDSVSTTSSASPPLGATSLLSALAEPEPITPQKQSDKSRPRYQDAEPELMSLPGSVRSHSELNQNSNAGLGLPVSRSFPRLHQPTVIRRTSGRGLAFVPSAPQVHAAPTISHSALTQHESPSSVSFEDAGPDPDPEEARSLQAAARLAMIQRQLLPPGRTVPRHLDPDTSSSSLPVTGEEPPPMTPEEEASIRINPDPYTPDRASVASGPSSLAHPSPRPHSSAYTQLVNKATESEVLSSMYPRLEEDLTFYDHDPAEEAHFSFESTADQFEDVPSHEISPPSEEVPEDVDSAPLDHHLSNDGHQHKSIDLPASSTEESDLPNDALNDSVISSVDDVSAAHQTSQNLSAPVPLDMQMEGGHEQRTQEEVHPETMARPRSSQHSAHDSAASLGDEISVLLSQATLSTPEVRPSETVPASVRRATEQWGVPSVIPCDRVHDSRIDDLRKTHESVVRSAEDVGAGSRDTHLEPSASKRVRQTAQKGKAPSPWMADTETLHEVDEMIMPDEMDVGESPDDHSAYGSGSRAVSSPSSRTHTRGPSNESELMLNEVSIETGIDEPESEAGRFTVLESHAQSRPPSSLGDHAGEDTRVARYKARDGSPVYVYGTAATTTDRGNLDLTHIIQGDEQNMGASQARSVSLYAGLTRGSKPLPHLISYRMELYLVWPEAAHRKLFTWIPGRKYVPDWNLKIVGGGRANDPFVVDVRGLARAIVGRIPVFGRLAVYM
ncbi:hypothetical protein IAT40_001782 [Kwoniella sp. CBS 6097]